MRTIACALVCVVALLAAGCRSAPGSRPPANAELLQASGLEAQVQQFLRQYARREADGGISTDGGGVAHIVYRGPNPVGDFPPFGPPWNDESVEYPGDP